MDTLRKFVRGPVSGLQRLLERGFGHDLNPMNHLGALTIYFLWIVLVSGIWVLIFFRTSLDGAYESVERITDQWYLGGVMRSLHRYASDAAVVTLFLHMVKEFAYDRYRGARFFSWVTGVPLLWLLFPLGITGYWLVWDKLAQYIALNSAEFLDWLPIFTDSMTRNFLSEASLSDRFFTLMAFLHLIGLPLFLVLGIWLHVFRMNGPRINPPRGLALGALGAMLALSFVYPAVSQGPANFEKVPAALGLDWFYLLVYPVVEIGSAGWLWLLLTGITLLLCILPWLPRAPETPPAKVNLDFCNGCGRCVDDCPFSAVALAPRSDGKRYEHEAVVDPDLCTRCGICVGACPTATPFRTRGELVPGIDITQPSAAELKENLLQAHRNGDPPKITIFCCRDSEACESLRKVGLNPLEVACMGQIPPPFIDFALNREHAHGVFLAGCGIGECRQRLGATWTDQRVFRERDPKLRSRVDRDRLALGWREPWSNHDSPADAVAAFSRSLGRGPDRERRHIPAVIRVIGTVAAGLVFATLIGWFSSNPEYRLLPPGKAVLSLSFSHAGERIEACKRLTQDELNELPPNMRTPVDCPRGRHPILVHLEVDGETLYHEERPPTGIWDDGESTVYERLVIPTGKHHVHIAMRDNPGNEQYDYEQETSLELDTAQHVVIEFDPERKEFAFR